MKGFKFPIPHSPTLRCFSHNFQATDCQAIVTGHWSLVTEMTIHLDSESLLFCRVHHSVLLPK